MTLWTILALVLAATAVGGQLLRRRIDAVTIGVIGLLTYHHPILLHWIRADAGSVDVVSLIATKAIAAMWFSLCLATLLTSTIPTPMSAQPLREMGNHRVQIAAISAIAIAVVSWCLVLATLEVDFVLSATKRAIMDVGSGGRLYIAAFAFTATAMIFACLSRSPLIILASLTIMAIDVLLLRNRSTLVLSGIAIALVICARHKLPKPTFRSGRGISVAVVAILFVIGVSEIYPFFMGYLRGAPINIDRIATKFSGAEGIVLSEPHTISLLLHTSMERGAHLPSDHLMLELTNQVIPNGAIETTSFNAVVQDAYFPDVPSGMGNSIIGEVWATSGLPGVLIGSLIWGGTLVVISLAMRSTRSLGAQAAMGIIAAIVGFYAFRCGLGYTIQLCKRYAAAIIIAWIVASLLSTVIPYYRVDRRTHGCRH